MSSAAITGNLHRVQERIATACLAAARDPSTVTLIAVTKTVDVPAIRRLYELGVRDFGESRPQSLWKKTPQLPQDARWHLIGHLQTNKVRRTLPLCHCVHSLDRMPLAEAISAANDERSPPIRATVQVNLTGESNKQGFSIPDLFDHYDSLLEFSGLKIVGLMTMARQEDDPERCRETFAALRELRNELRSRRPETELPTLSMGMSQDFPVAIEEGATHVRIGSALFEGLEV